MTLLLPLPATVAPAFDRYVVRGEEPELPDLMPDDLVAGPDGEPFFGDGFLDEAEEGRP